MDSGICHAEMYDLSGHLDEHSAGVEGGKGTLY